MSNQYPESQYTEAELREALRRLAQREDTRSASQSRMIGSGVMLAMAAALFTPAVVGAGQGYSQADKTLAEYVKSGDVVDGGVNGYVDMIVWIGDRVSRDPEVARHDVSVESTAEKPEAVSPTESTPTSTSTPEPSCEEQLAQTPEEKLAAGLVMWPVEGDGTTYNGTLNPSQTQEFLKRNSIGGVVVTTEPGDTIKGIVKKIIVVAIDDEGKVVQRARDDSRYFPTAPEMATMTPEQVADIAAWRAGLLKSYGINTALAPVTDVGRLDDEPSSVGEERIFSDDPAIVAKYAGIYAGELKKNGINPVYKHAMGATMQGKKNKNKNTDDEPGVTAPWTSLQDHDAKVFTNYNLPIKGIGMMIHSAEVPGLTEGKPAGLHPALYDVMRSYGFNSFMTTDDLGTKAINMGLSQAFAKALASGASMGLFVKNENLPDPTAQEQLNNITAAIIKSLTKEQMIEKNIINATFTGKSVCDLADFMNK